MKLVIGLGNPGNEYNNTRHNVGFMVLDKIAEKLNQLNWSKKFDGLYFDKIIEKEKIIFVKPQKYMNLSGEVVQKYVDYFNIELDDILIIVDDLDLPIGKIRLRQNGRSAGHNGLKNIFLNLNSENIKRIKIGIGNNKKIDTKDYVLGKFSKEDIDIMKNATEQAANIVLEFVKENFSNLMSKYN